MREAGYCTWFGVRMMVLLVLLNGFPVSHYLSAPARIIASRLVCILRVFFLVLTLSKQWLFDSPTAAPRLLKFRAGHHAPPHLIRYYGQDGKQILTASRDRSLRCTSVVRDSRSFELSQGNILTFFLRTLCRLSIALGSLAKKATTLSIPIASLKFPPVTSISYSSARTKDWDDILTGHADETFARSWTMQNKKLGKYNLGFADNLKGKGKERRSLGSVKVCPSFKSQQTNN